MVCRLNDLLHGYLFNLLCLIHMKYDVLRAMTLKIDEKKKASSELLICTTKPVLSGHSKRRLNIVFSDRFSLNAGEKYCRMFQESILQYLRPSLSYHLSLRPLFCLLLSGRVRLTGGFTVVGNDYDVFKSCWSSALVLYCVIV